MSNFHAPSTISAAIGVILRELEAACDPACSLMSRTAWSTQKSVSGQSPYVDDLARAVEQLVEAVKPLVEQKKYLRNLMDKVAKCVVLPLRGKHCTEFTHSVVLSKFTNALVKSRPLKEVGAEQLLIDLQALKTALLRIPGEDLTTTKCVFA